MLTKPTNGGHCWATLEVHKSNRIAIVIELKGNEKVLDIGCKDGKITAKIASYLPNSSVLGVDMSSETINFAKSKFALSDYPINRWAMPTLRNYWCWYCSSSCGM